MAAFLLVAVLLTAGTSGEPAENVAPGDRAGAAEPEVPGWPTAEMFEAQARHLVDELAKDFGLSDAQREKLEILFVDRWTRLFKAHGDDLKQLVSEHLAARKGEQPPTAEYVSAWARRAGTLVDRLEREAATTIDEFDRILTSEQRERFTLDRQYLERDLAEVRREVEKWKRGEFEERDWWNGPRSESAPASQPTTQPAAEPADPVREIDAELDAWSQYVVEFCEAHGLDATQRKAAYSILKELTARAKDHRESRRAELVELERLIADPGSTTEEKIAARLQELYGPIDEMFEELQVRLDRIPTDAQRRRAQAIERPPAGPEPSTTPLE